MSYSGGVWSRSRMSVAAFHRCASRSSGFTLIELIVVVAILGILATIAIPNFTKLSTKSRRAEAFESLHALSVAQLAYFTEQGSYAPNFDLLGFQIEGGVRIDATTIQGQHYTYTLAPLALNGNPNGNYRATATGDIDASDPFLDVVVIENQLTVVE